MYQIVLLRHGESLWNKENRFTGWTDVDLSNRGISEARKAGRIFKKSGFTFDVAFTSLLKKAIRTLWIVLDEMDLMWIPIRKSWRLNERYYGKLQGLNKSETAKKYGETQVHLWRRSYDIRPPAIDKNDERYPGKDARYKNLSEDELPLSENLEDTSKRLYPYWKNEIIPEIIASKKILIVAHGNSIRAIVKVLENSSKHEIEELNIPTGVPLIYELDKKLDPLKHYYLGDAETINKAITSVAEQGKIQG